MLPIRRTLQTTSCLTAALLCVLPGMVFANPIDGNVVAGSASIAAAGNTLNVTQHTNKAVIDWRGFDIGAGEHTQFSQPNAQAIVLNRVNSNQASHIDGKLTANGNVVIVNQNGVMFGRGAQVDVNGLVATTADTNSDAFMQGNKLVLDKPGNPNAAVVNYGSITAKQAGLVGFVAPNVANHGIISAKLGKVALASGDTVTVDMYGDSLLEVAVSNDVKSQIVANTGVIAADGGEIQLTAAAGGDIVNSLITVKGALSARSVGNKQGKITIAAKGSNKTQKQGDSVVLVEGMLDASGRNVGERGGAITVTGDQVMLLGGAFLDASGHSGLAGTTTGQAKSAYRKGSAGGDIRVGGDYLGQSTTQAAKNLYVDAGALVINDALFSGDAGRTIFWSDNTTAFYGNVYARALGGKSVDAQSWHAVAGGNAGDGGFVETSGHGHLDAGGYVDLTASNGSRGTYFLDPTNITIYGNVDPAFISTDGSINLASSLRLWLDASDTANVNLTYNSLGTTATGSSGTNTITVSANTNLAVGARIRLGSAGAVTAANTLGADTYTITNVSGNTITLSSNLTTNYSGSGVFQGYVSQLTDKSGLANNAIQGTANNMPLWISNGLNSLGVAKFNNSTTSMQGSIGATGNNLSIFSTGYFNQLNQANGDYDYIFNLGNGAGGSNLSISRSGVNVGSVVANGLYSYDGTDARGGPVITGQAWALLGSILNASAPYYTFNVNGANTNVPDHLAVASTNGVYTLGQYAPGASHYLDGQIADSIIYGAALSTNAQALVNQYQSAKWGIALTPPGTGATEVAKATASDGYSVFTTRYLERLSQTADISLQATNNINLDLKGDTLNFATSGRSLTLNAGNQITTASTGTITTNNGNINLTGTNGIIFNHAIGLNSNGGNITFNNAVTSSAAQSWHAGIGNMTFNSTYTGTGNNLTLSAAQMDINGTINVGTNTLTLKPTTAKATRVGRSTDNGDDATYLDISAPEMARIQAGTLSIGDVALASPITIAGNLDLTGATGAAGVYNLTFNTAGTFDSSGYTVNLGRDALSFDGVNDGVNLGNGNLNPTGAITLSAWVYIDGANNNYGSIFTDWGTSSNPYYVGTQINNSSAIEVYFNSSLIFTVLNNPLNSWMNLTVTNDGSTVNAYRNGVLVNTGAGTLAAASSGVTAIGYDINRSNYAFKGHIDDARIYNTTLDATAISALYNGGAGSAFTTATGLLGGYNFSAGSGTSAVDISGSSNTGTLTNGPTWVRANNLTVNAGGAVTLGNTWGDGSDISVTGSSVTLAGKVAAMGDGTLNIASTNNITINNGASAYAGGAGNSLVLRSSAGNFINNANASALNAGNGRWIVYSQSAGANTAGGITAPQTIAGNTYGTLAPSSITGPTYNASQNTWVYSGGGGTLRFTANNLTRIYGDLNPVFTYSFWCSTGCTEAAAVTGAPTLTSLALQGSNIGSYGISIVQGAMALTGAYAGYTFDFVAGTLTVDPRTITAALTGAVSKIYNGTTAATLAGGNYSLSNVYNSDDVVLNNPVSGTYDTKNVGTGKTVSVTGLSISGTKSGNYILASTSASGAVGDITARNLTVTATDKSMTYGAGNTFNGYSISGLQNGETIGGVTLATNATSSTSGNWNYNAAPWTITASNAVGGTFDINNYNVTYSAGALNVARKALAVTATGINKVYDGLTSASVNYADDRIASDVLTASGTATFGDKNVANGKAVSVTGIGLSGTDAGNYTPNATTSTTANITARALTLASITASDKIYDGLATATLTGYAFDAAVGGDALSITGLAGAFNSKNVGTRTASATAGTLAGTDAGNYSFTLGAVTDTADITARGLTVTALDKSMTYGAGNIFNSYSVSGLQNGETVDSVTLSTNATTSGSGNWNYRAAPWAITASNATGGTFDINNYNVSYVTGALNIARKALAVTTAGINKIYDGLTGASVTYADNRIAGDVLTVGGTATYGDKNVANGKTVSVAGIGLSGADADNYTANATTSTTANITPASLTVTAHNKSIAFGDPDPALTYGYSGLVGGDVGASFTGTLARTSGSTVGNYSILQNTLDVSGNYMLGQFNPGTFTIVALPVSIIPNTVTYVSQVPQTPQTPVVQSQQQPAAPAQQQDQEDSNSPGFSLAADDVKGPQGAFSDKAMLSIDPLLAKQFALTGASAKNWKF